MLQPAMLGYHQRRGTEHDLTSGWDGVGAPPWVAGGRDSIGRSAETEGEAMLTDFYAAFATVCFTLLGLWIVVVQTRHGEWRHSPVHRRRAYGVALHFSLPGLMSLLSLVDPASTTLWRISFVIVAAGGVLALALVRGPAPTGLGAAAYVVAVVLYVLIALVAVMPGLVADIGLLVRPLRVEAVLQTILVFLGVNVAWLLLFDEASPPSALGQPG
jgi:hypothetical protein